MQHQPGVAHQAITICFCAGLLMTALAVLGLPNRIFGLMPVCVKNAMPVGLGMLLALCGFQQMKVVVSDPDTGVTMGRLGPELTVGVASTLLMVTTTPLFYPPTTLMAMPDPLTLGLEVYMDTKHSELKFFVPILLAALVGWTFSLEEDPNRLYRQNLNPKPKPPGDEALNPGRIPQAEWPDSILEVPTFDTSLVQLSTLDMSAIAPIFAIYIICLFDVGGVMYSVCSVAGLVSDAGVLPGAYGVFVSAAIGSCCSAYFGCVPVIVLGESFAGVFAGGNLFWGNLFWG